MVEDIPVKDGESVSLMIEGVPTKEGKLVSMVIEGVPVKDNKSSILFGGFESINSKIKLFAVAIFMATIMLLLSLSMWIIDGVVDEIKKDLGIYDRVPVWERSEWPYITDQGNGFVMEYGEYQILDTENEWNSTHHFVNF